MLAFQAQQALEEGFGNAHLGDARHDSGVEGLRFVAVDDDEVGRRLAVEAAGEQQAEGSANPERARGVRREP